MTETTTSGVTVPLVRWVDQLTPEQIPEAVRSRARHLLLDGVAYGLAGAQLPWSRVATRVVLDLKGAGDAAVIGTGATTSAPAAVLLNSTFVQGFELDDFHPLAPLHSNSLVLPVLPATAHHLGGVSGRDALTAAIAGFEVGPRVGAALHGTQMLSRGWHSGPVFGSTPPRRITEPHGGPSDPVTGAELVAKYRSLAGPLMPAGRLDAIQRAVLGIDELADIRELTELPAAPVAGALDGKEGGR